MSMIRIGLSLLAAVLASPALAAPADTTAFPYTADAGRSTPGVSLRLVSLGRVREVGVNEVDYRVEAKGFPRGRVYRLWFARLGDPADALCGALVVDSTGTLVPSDSAAAFERSLCPPLSEIVLGASDYLPGEPYRVGLISTDDSVRSVATAFPIPIESRDGPCRILLERMTADGRAFTLWGVGFEPDETLRTRITADGETREGPAFADAKGALRIQLSAPSGQAGGEVTYEVIARGGRPKITYRWGSGP